MGAAQFGIVIMVMVVGMRPAAARSHRQNAPDLH